MDMEELSFATSFIPHFYYIVCDWHSVDVNPCFETTHLVASLQFP